VRRLAAALLILVGLAAAWSGSQRLHVLAGESGETPLMYLPNGKYLRVASLGHAGTVADMVYLWAIQYYADYTQADRARYVEHVFGSVIPDLDPRFVDAYALGALILAVEVRDLEAALRVLQRGIRENPDQWILPYIAGWECYHAGRPDLAARYLAQAAGIPGAPAVLVRNQAGMVARSGDLRGAWAVWRDIHEDPGQDESTRRIALARMNDLEVRIELGELQDAVATFRGRTGRIPSGAEALVRAGLILEAPVDPDGEPYRIDPSTGVVSTAGGRTLESR
jgi:hypothetical protein